MNLSCDVVMDLIALYHDGESSAASTAAVREHLNTCRDCRVYYKDYVDTLPVEQGMVRLSQADYSALAKRMRTRRAWMVAGILAYVSASLCAVILLVMRMKAE